MNITDTLPEAFPGKDLSTKWGGEYIYELSHVRYGRTTDTDEIITIPDIEYRAFAEMAYGLSDRYIDSGAGKIGEEVLTSGQLRAIKIAGQIETRRQAEDPTLDNFVSLRKIKLDNNEQMYICSPREGASLDSDVPFAAVGSAKKLGIIDFATAVQGYYGFFKYNARDIDEFIPEELAGQANAYSIIDEPRIVVGANGERDYQIVKILLLDVDSDLDFNLKLLDRTVRIIRVDNDGTETVTTFDPDKE